LAWAVVKVLGKGVCREGAELRFVGENGSFTALGYVASGLPQGVAPQGASGLVTLGAQLAKGGIAVVNLSRMVQAASGLGAAPDWRRGVVVQVADLMDGERTARGVVRLLAW
jgi:hypothetical protein